MESDSENSPKTIRLIYDEYLSDTGKTMSCISLRRSEDEEEEEEKVEHKGLSESLPGTPNRAEHVQKEYTSEAEAAVHWGEGGARRRRMREKWLERAKCLRGECRVAVKSTGPNSGPLFYMDMEEVRACKDLGFELPSGWTVQIPSASETSTDCTDSPSPIGSWRITNPGKIPFLSFFF